MLVGGSKSGCSTLGDVNGDGSKLFSDEIAVLISYERSECVNESDIDFGLWL